MDFAYGQFGALALQRRQLTWQLLYSLALWNGAAENTSGFLPPGRGCFFSVILTLDFFSAVLTPPNEHFLPEGLGIELLTFQQQQEYFIPFQSFVVCVRAGNLSD